VAESLLSRLFPERFQVSSYPHQGIKALGKGLKALALAPDELVEAEGYSFFLGGSSGTRNSSRAPAAPLTPPPSRGAPGSWDIQGGRAMLTT